MDLSESKKQPIKLFSDFPPVNTEAWEDLIKNDLKGADYERKLIWKTINGFDVKPYYQSEDLNNLTYPDNLPGDFPFLRACKSENNNWRIRQDIKVDDICTANKYALEILMKGVDSIGFLLNRSVELTYETIEKLMENIHPEAVEVNFTCGSNAVKVLEYYQGLMKQRQVEFRNIYGSVDFDPIGNLLTRGSFYSNKTNDFETCRALLLSSEDLKYFTVLEVNAGYFKNAGSSIVEELGFGLAYGNEYLSGLSERGISAGLIASKIKFHFATGSDYFLEIAKLRAMRLLWANIVNAYGDNESGNACAHIHSSTSDWNKTMYDPAVNILRSTTETMAAIIGGCESVTVRPYNSTFAETTSSSDRYARNQQLLLKEESFFDKVIDPAAGSYYIESLTSTIAEHAWKLFLEIEEAGGFTEAFKKGIIQNKINETARRRDHAISSRKEILLGTNQYPNLKEVISNEPVVKAIQPDSHAGSDAIAEPLRIYRGAQGFERLRSKTDLYSRDHKRPSVFMFTYGNLSMRRARSQFSGNFFGCAGFDIIDTPGFKTIDEGIKAALDSKAEIVVICAADEDYPFIAPEIFQKIGTRSIVVVAGLPKDYVEELKSKGIKYFIHTKSNVLETLEEFQRLIGIQ